MKSNFDSGNIIHEKIDESKPMVERLLIQIQKVTPKTTEA